MRFWWGLLPVAAALGQAPEFRAERVLPSGSARHVKLTSGMLVSIYGENLGPESQCAANTEPLELCGVRVTLGGAPAALLYVSRQQINFKVPRDVPSSDEAELK